MPRQKLRDAAFILPFFGLVLIMPPFVDIFFSVRLIGGIPVILLYIFCAWTLLIVLGWLLSRRMMTDGDEREPRTGIVRPEAPERSDADG